MALVEGYGLCGICGSQIETPTPPLRHWNGNVMAHKTCYDKRKLYELTDEYQVELAQKEVQDATNRYNVAANALLTAKNKLAKLTGVSVDVIE